MDYISEMDKGNKIVCKFKEAQKDYMGNSWQQETWYKKCDSKLYTCIYLNCNFTTEHDKTECQQLLKDTQIMADEDECTIEVISTDGVIFNTKEESNLFILSTISIREKTSIDLQKQWEIRNIKCDKQVTYYEYIAFLENWGDLKYYFSSEDNCYFTDLETAKDYALSNIADINDGGVYNYVSIVEVPFNRAYATTNIKNIWVFKYVGGERLCDGIYEEIDINFSEEAKLIVKKNNYIVD